MIRRFWPILLIVVALGACSRWYRQDDAIRSLKVLNSDLTNMLIATDELPESKAMKFIWDQPSAPVPFPKEKFVYDRPYESYDFAKVSGQYRWDTINGVFMKQSDSDNVSIEYLDSGIGKINLIIHEFLSVPISSKPDFPLKVNAELWVDENVQTILKHEATIADELLLKSRTNIKGTNYEIDANFDRTRNGDNGTIESGLTIIYDNSEVIRFRINATIGYSTLGYYFEKIYFTADIFRHYIYGKIDYDLINPTSEDYVSSFNNNSKIEIFEHPLKRKVGNIVLAKVKEGELLDYHIKFRNNQTELLSEFLPIINKILNVKL